MASVSCESWFTLQLQTTIFAAQSSDELLKAAFTHEDLASIRTSRARKANFEHILKFKSDLVNPNREFWRVANPLFTNHWCSLILSFVGEKQNILFWLAAHRRTNLIRLHSGADCRSTSGIVWTIQPENHRSCPKIDRRFRNYTKGVYSWSSLKIYKDSSIVWRLSNIDRVLHLILEIIFTHEIIWLADFVLELIPMQGHWNPLCNVSWNLSKQQWEETQVTRETCNIPGNGQTTCNTSGYNSYRLLFSGRWDLTT